MNYIEKQDAFSDHKKDGILKHIKEIWNCARCGKVCLVDEITNKLFDYTKLHICVCGKIKTIVYKG